MQTRAFCVCLLPVIVLTSSPALAKPELATMTHKHFEIKYDRNYPGSVPKGNMDNYAAWVRRELIDIWEKYEKVFPKAMPKKKQVVQFVDSKTFYHKHVSSIWGNDYSDPQWSAWDGTIYVPYKPFGSELQQRWELAHELFHAVQNTQYWALEMAESRWLMEMSAEYAACRIALGRKKMTIPLSPNYLEKSFLVTDKRHEYESAQLLDHLCPTVDKFKTEWDRWLAQAKKTNTPRHAFFMGLSDKPFGPPVRLLRFFQRVAFDPAMPVATKKGPSEVVQQVARMRSDFKEITEAVRMGGGPHTAKIVGVTLNQTAPKRRVTVFVDQGKFPLGIYLYATHGKTLKSTETIKNVREVMRLGPVDMDVIKGEKVYLLVVETAKRPAYATLNVKIRGDGKVKEKLLNLTGDVVITPKSWSKAQNRTRLAMGGALNGAGKMPGVAREFAGPGGSKILQVYNPLHWNDPASLKLDVNLKPAKGLDWKHQGVFPGNGKDYSGYVRTRLTQPRIVVVDNKTRKETVQRGYSLKFDIPTGPPKDPAKKFQPSEVQFSGYISLLFDCECNFVEIDKTGQEILRKTEKSEVRLYLANYIFIRKR